MDAHPGRGVVSAARLHRRGSFHNGTGRGEAMNGDSVVNGGVARTPPPPPALEGTTAARCAGCATESDAADSGLVAAAAGGPRTYASGGGDPGSTAGNTTPAREFARGLASPVTLFDLEDPDDARR
jgi:hypothetical protein